jgi:hypothetical protein
LELQQHYRVEYNENQRPADHSEAVQSETSNDASDSKPNPNVPAVMFTDRPGDSYPSLSPSMLPHDVNTGPSVGGPGHSCNVCGKTFGLKQSLKVHWLTHARVVESMLSKLMIYFLTTSPIGAATGGSPVPCTQCSRAFIRRDCLLRHLRTKHCLPHNEALLVTNLIYFISIEYLKRNVFIFQTVQDMTRDGSFRRWM